MHLATLKCNAYIYNDIYFANSSNVCLMNECLMNECLMNECLSPDSQRNSQIKGTYVHNQ